MRTRLFDFIFKRNLLSHLPLKSAEDQLFFPTSGRWLWNEESKVRQHTQRFDVTALKNVVADLTGLAEGQTDRVTLSKLAEGASNKVYLATTGQQRLIVKVPDPLVPRRLVTASEVATLNFLRVELGLPVPKVLAWNDDGDNGHPVGCEYIIMEEATGQDLKHVWPTLSTDERIGVVDQMIAIQTRLLEVSKTLAGYGSLYFDDDAARFGFQQRFSLLTQQSPKFCIGPLAHSHHIGLDLDASAVDRGPWRTPEEYLVSVAQSSLTQIQHDMGEGSDTASSTPFSFPVNPGSDLSKSTVCNMLKTACTVIPHIVPQSADERIPLLWHPDLHDGNILVANSKITSIVDWQDANVLPMFLYLRKPQFLDVPDKDLVFELPEGFEEMTSPTKSETWERFMKSMLQGYYLSHFRGNLPTVAAVFDNSQVNSLRRRVWHDLRMSDRNETDAMMLRNTLLQVQKNWATLAPMTSANKSPACPIAFYDVELQKHHEDARIFNQFRDIIEGSEIQATFSLDGWAPVELFTEWRRNLDRVTRDVMNSLVTEKERKEFQKRLSLWNLTKE